MNKTQHTLNYLLKRTDDSKFRNYFKWGAVEDGFFISTTTWQKKTLPMDPGLLRWIKTKTPEEQNEILFETSHLGTFLHEITKEYTDHDQSFALDHIGDYIQDYRNREPELTLKDVQGWADRSGNWIYSVDRFFKDRNVVPLTYYSEVLESEQPMTEVALIYEPHNPELGDIFPEMFSEQARLWDTMDVIESYYARYPQFPHGGAIDLVCELDWQGTRKIAIVDYKTGSIWNSHRYQLEDYKLLVESNFIEVDLILNFTDKGWDKTKKPTYTLTNQTDKVSPQEMASLFRLAEQWINPNPGYHIEYENIVKGEGGWNVLSAEEYYAEQDKEEN